MNLDECADIFYKNLLLNDDISDNDNDNDMEDTCLITHQKLDNTHVKLECGHKFNYEPIFRYVYNQKTKFNKLESFKTALKQDQLMCPYCRNVQGFLLPYFKKYNFNKVHGVNYLNYNKIDKHERTCSAHWTSIMMGTNPSEEYIYKCMLVGTKIQNSMDKNYYCVHHKQQAKSKLLKSDFYVESAIYNKCSYVFKKGKNKDNSCSCKIFKNNYCKRHYKE